MPTIGAAARLSTSVRAVVLSSGCPIGSRFSCNARLGVILGACSHGSGTLRAEASHPMARWCAT
jgi:hypothetical protein